MVFDFKNLTTSELYEKKTNVNDELLDLDDEFQDTHLLILERFYTPFDNLYKPVQNFNKFIEDPTSVNGMLTIISGVVIATS